MRGRIFDVFSGVASGEMLALRGRYWLACAIAIVLICVPMKRLVQVDFAAYERANNAQRAMAIFDGTLRAYYAVSAERAPANALLGIVPESDRAERLSALALARQKSDAALDALAQDFTQKNGPHCGQAHAAILHVKQELADARARIDRLHARPGGRLNAHEISEGIAEMIGVTAKLNFVLNRAMSILEQYESAVASDVQLARLAAELREYAERLGSLLTATLVTDGLLNSRDLHAIHRTEGRIEQLREQLFSSLEIRQGDVPFRAISEQISGMFFDSAYRTVRLSVNDHSIQHAGTLQLTSATMADQYVPAMAPIVVLRDHMIGEAQQKLQGFSIQKRNRLAQTIGCCVLILMLVVGAMVFFGTRYVSPLQGLVDALLSMSQETLPSKLQLAAVSHDIQSPQSAILALLEMSRSDGAYKASPEIFGMIEAYARRTLSLVDEFIELSRLQSCRQKCLAPIDMHGVVLDACDFVAVAAVARRIAVVVNADEAMPVVRGDRAVLVRAIVNLLDNAIKYSPEGSQVHCQISREGKAVTLRIRDAGYGIDSKDMRFLFKRFRRFSAPGQPPVKGSGLGLVFARSAIRRMRGDITCDSKIGCGSTFTVWLPASKSL